MLKNSKKQAFTLIELLVVIVIIGVLATISIPTFSGYFEKARIAKLAARIVQEKRLFQVECVALGRSPAECPVSYSRYAIPNAEMGWDHYGATPRYCETFCEEKTNESANQFVRVSTKEEAVWFAATAGQVCAGMWHYMDDSAKLFSSGYPMYYNRTTSGCGLINTGDIARFVHYYENNINRDSLLKNDCACITYPRIH